MVKRLLFLLAAILLCFSGHAQGTINFYNRGITGPNGTTYNWPVLGDTRDVQLQLYLVTGRLGSETYTPVAGRPTFRPAPDQAWFTEPVLATVPGQAPGTSGLTFVIRAWRGESYDTATIRGQSDSFTVGPLGGENPAGGPPFPHPDLGGINGVGGISPTSRFTFPSFPVRLEFARPPPYIVLNVAANETVWDFQLVESIDLNTWRPLIYAFSRLSRFSLVDRSSPDSHAKYSFYRVSGNALTANEMLERWRTLNMRSYQFTFSRTCFSCQPLSLTATATVRDEKVVAVENVRDNTGSPFEGADLSEFKSIEELFGSVATEAPKADLLSIRLHESLHFPLWIYIDYNHDTVDDELEYRATNLRRLE